MYQPPKECAIQITGRLPTPAFFNLFKSSELRYSMVDLKYTKSCKDTKSTIGIVLEPDSSRRERKDIVPFPNPTLPHLHKK